MAPYYEPLRLVEEPPPTSAKKFRDFFRLGLTPRAQSLVDQMKARSEVPPEVWGPDPARRELAQTIAQIVEAQVYWPNANFIPEDSFEAMVFNFHYDGTRFDNLEIETVIAGLERMSGLRLDIALWAELGKKTFGEVVDFFLLPCTTMKRLEAPLPLSGPDSLESRHCPTMAAFLDIRFFLAQPFLAVAPRKVRPSARLRDTLHIRLRRDLSRYIAARFGVNPRLSERFLGPEFTLGCLATIGLALVYSAVLASCLGLLSPKFFDASMFLLPIAVLVLGTSITFCLMLPRVLVQTWRWFRWGKRPSLRTFGDLARWIPRARARLSPTAWPEPRTH